MSEIAVIIPAYQAAGTIGTTLTTLFTQTTLPKEVVVVDDGSTDDVTGAIAPWADRLTYLRQENSGAPAARNLGFDHTSAEFVLFLDADIRMEPAMLEEMENALQTHLDAAYAYSDFRFGWKHFHLWPYSYPKLKEMNYIHTSSLIRRSAFPRFDPSLKKFQDWDLWLTIAEQGGHGIWVNKILYTVQQRKRGLGLSAWLPKFIYQLPFIGRGRGNKSIASYREAEKIIRQKHHLVAVAK